MRKNNKVGKVYFQFSLKSKLNLGKFKVMKERIIGNVLQMLH